MVDSAENSSDSGIQTVDMLPRSVRPFFIAVTGRKRYNPFWSVVSNFVAVDLINLFSALLHTVGRVDVAN